MDVYLLWMCYEYPFCFVRISGGGFSGVSGSCFWSECIQTVGGSDGLRSTKYSIRAVVLEEWYLNDSPTCIRFPLSCLPLTVLIIR